MGTEGGGVMKLAGGALVILGGLLWGWERARALSRRVARLTELQKLIQWLRTEISYSARPLTSMLLTGDSLFCREAVALPAFDRDPREALAQAGEALLENEKDRRLVRDLTAGLGASDVQGQLEHLQLYFALTGENLDEAREACREKRRLYLGLGVLAGMGICIVMI